jgi:hypothetical protein
VTAADLMLVGQPVVAVVGGAGVADPLAEAGANLGEVVADRGAGRVAELGEQVGLAGDEAIPDVE